MRLYFPFRIAVCSIRGVINILDPAKTICPGLRFPLCLGKIQTFAWGRYAPNQPEVNLLQSSADGSLTITTSTRGSLRNSSNSPIDRLNGAAKITRLSRRLVQ